jgi:hypothetical protein
MASTVRVSIDFFGNMYRLVEVGVLLTIFRSLEQNLYSAIKPSDETLEQGRNRDYGELFELTLTLTLTLRAIIFTLV